MQRFGNQQLQHLLRGRVPQAKLTVSDPDDVYEQEAERVADHVMRMPEPVATLADTASTIVQRRCSNCEEQLHRSTEEEELLQMQSDELHLQRQTPPDKQQLQLQSLGSMLQRRMPEGEAVQLERSESAAPLPSQVSPRLEASLGSLSGRGSVLPDPVRAFMEPRFDADFSAVRVHTDLQAQSLARVVNARAITVGSNLVFGAGHYELGTHGGQRLLAHELTHVVQQSAVSPDPGPAGTLAQGTLLTAPHCVPSSDSFEREGNRPTERAVRGVPALLPSRARRRIQRQPVTDADEEQQRLERASARGRARQSGDAALAMLAAAEVVHRLMQLHFPFFADSVTGVGLADEAQLFVNIEPSTAGAKLDTDIGFRIDVDRRFLGEELFLQKFWLQFALERLPTLAGAGVGNYEGGLRAAGHVLQERLLPEIGEVSGFGSTTGAHDGEPDAADAYDASLWREVDRKRIRTDAEPSRAMRRLVDTLDRHVPKAGGGQTRWRMDCFDAVVFARIFANWKTMSRFAFNRAYYPLELGFNSKTSKTEWEPAIIAMSVGGPRLTGDETVVVGTRFEIKQTNVPESFADLVARAPIGSQVVWKNFDAEKRCNKAKQAGTDLPVCESWQAENATKIGDDEFLAYPLGIKSEAEIKTALAQAALDDIPSAQRLPIDQYIRRNIGVSLVRFPKH